MSSFFFLSDVRNFIKKLRLHFLLHLYTGILNCNLRFLQLISVDFLLKFILDPVALFCFVEQFSAIRCKYKN